MTKENATKGLNITRERMIQLLNEDLAGEYQAIIAYTVYSQVLKDPVVQSFRSAISCILKG
jgi:bacterioferritin